LKDKNYFFSEMNRILQKGGTILIRSPFEKDIPFSINYIYEKFNYDKFWQKRNKAGHFAENAVSKKDLLLSLKKSNFKIIKFRQTNFFIDQVYDYVLPKYLKRIFNKTSFNQNKITNLPLEKNNIFIKLSYKKRILNQLLKIFRTGILSFDNFFCLIGCGNHFITVCEKVASKKN
jgi:hypothetical protein